MFCILLLSKSVLCQLYPIKIVLIMPNRFLENELGKHKPFLVRIQLK